MLEDGQCGVHISAEVRGFPLAQNVHTGSRAHLTSYSMATMLLSQAQSGQGTILTTHLHIVLQYKAVNSAAPISLMTLTGKT